MRTRTRRPNPEKTSHYDSHAPRTIRAIRPVRGFSRVTCNGDESKKQQARPRVDIG
jgi:hypothetical protein